MQYAQKGDYMRRRTEAQAQAQAEKRYKAKTYKTFTVNAKVADYEKIVTFCNSKSISKAQLLLKAAMYIIDNNITV